MSEGTYLPEESRTAEDRLKLRAAAVNKGIRKVGKAHWTFSCGMCGMKASGPDHWTVYEAGWNHNRDAAATHLFTAAQGAIDGLAGAFMEMGRAVSRSLAAISQVDFALAPPTNMPHDPSLLKDRRKWGGR